MVKFSRNGVPPLCLAFRHLKLSFHVTIFGKIFKIATRGQILKLKCTKRYFGWGSAPDAAGGNYRARPELIAGSGVTSKVHWREGREKEGRGLRKGMGGQGDVNVEFHHLLLRNLTAASSPTGSRLTDDKFEFYALLNRKLMKIFKNTR